MKKVILFFTLFSLSIQYTYSQWVQQTIPVSRPVTGIKFVNPQKGWATVGVINNSTHDDTGYVLYTTNSGTNWLIQLTKPSFTFYSISIVDSLIGYIGGDSIGGIPPFTTAKPKFYKTTDGGLSWIDIPLITNMAITDMQFINKDSAWECGFSTGPDVRTTTDGGLTWQVRMNGINRITQRVFFLNYNTGFCAAYSTFYKTTNAGTIWIQIGSFSQDPRSIYFVNENTGWIGTDFNKIYYTTNSGSNWISQALPLITNSGVYEIYFLNSNTGWAGIAELEIYKTTNSGVNWGYQEIPSGCYRISVVDSLNCWAAGLNLGISHTTNGGGPILGVRNLSNEVPFSYKLYQNYPNPFNPSTNIKYDIKTTSDVKLIVCDVLGRELRVPVNENQKPGTYEVYFSAEEFSSGVYFYKIIIRSGKEFYSETKKMIYIK